MNLNRTHDIGLRSFLYGPCCKDLGCYVKIVSSWRRKKCKPRPENRILQIGSRFGFVRPSRVWSWMSREKSGDESVYNGSSGILYLTLSLSHELGSHVPNPLLGAYSSFIYFVFSHPFFVSNHSLFKDWSLGVLAHISHDALVRDWYLIELQSNFNLQVSLV